MAIDQQTAEMINELSGLCGILPEYWDIFGKRHTATVETKKAMLRAMKMPVETDSDISKTIGDLKNRLWTGFVEPVFVISVNARPLNIPIYLPIRTGEEGNIALTCVVEDELKKSYRIEASGREVEILEERTIEGTRYVKALLSGEAPGHSGYFSAFMEAKLSGGTFPDGSGTLRKKTRLIIAPDSCYMPPELQSGKAWGLSVNLYSLQSKRSWGIGDFKDLRTMAEIMADFKSDIKPDFLGVNPLHAIPNTHPYGVSPYSPISRLYKNFIYLEIEDIPEVRESEEIQEHMKSQAFRRKLRNLRKSETVDYEKAGLLKEEVLGRAFDRFYDIHYKRGTGRDLAFRDFVTAEGECLDSFATFLALRDFFRDKKGKHAWQEWPQAYHDPCGEAVRAFKKNHGKKVLYYMYLQWLIDDQLLKISRHCKDIGMKIGLYHDIAIGAIAGGSDVWGYQEMIGDADVGAPPDDFNPNGQNWGFPSLIPDKLRENGYEVFIETIRKNMKYGGALRIDHALGLFRLFWIPAGAPAGDGAYLLQPAADLLRIIALESERNHTIVIAEDLGTIDDDYRKMLQSFQMLSYRLFYFERNYPDPSFKPPTQYPPMALCAITTHDLPTIYGYWAGRDIETKKQLGIYGSEGAWKDDVFARERDKSLILSALRREGLVPADFPEDPRMIPCMTHDLCIAIYRYLDRSPCKLLLVSLDDILGTLDQQNMPGTVDRHPNWIQKSSLSLEEIAVDPRFSGLSSLTAS
jgi:4-alpha-glucanotransferase